MIDFRRIWLLREDFTSFPDALTEPRPAADLEAILGDLFVQSRDAFAKVFAVSLIPLVPIREDMPSWGKTARKVLQGVRLQDLTDAGKDVHVSNLLRACSRVVLLMRHDRVFPICEKAALRLTLASRYWLERTVDGEMRNENTGHVVQEYLILLERVFPFAANRPYKWRHIARGLELPVQQSRLCAEGGNALEGLGGREACDVIESLNQPIWKLILFELLAERFPVKG